MTTPDAQRSEELRQEGNALYKKRRLAEASKAYFAAAKLAPSSANPLSNISAVRFEQGNYLGAILFSHKALSLLQAEDDTSPAKQKLFHRILKCQLHLGQVQKAHITLAKIAPSDSKHEAARLVSDLESLNEQSPNRKLLREQAFDRLPRFKQRLRTEPEFYCFGHEIAQPQFDDALKNSTKDGEQLSFLYCGIGDARNFFVTTLTAELFEREEWKFRQWHFTLLDIKPSVIARNLVFLCMLDQLPESEDLKSSWAYTVAYLYGTYIVPPSVNSRLETTMRQMVAALELTGQVLDYVYLPPVCRDPVIRALKFWLTPLSESFSVRTLRGMSSATEEAKEDKDDLAHFGVLFPPVEDVAEVDPLIRDLLAGHRAKKNGAASKLRRHIDQTWEINRTIIDYDWYLSVADNVKDLDTSHDSITLLPKIMGALSWEVAMKATGKCFSNTLHGLNYVFKSLGAVMRNLSSHTIIELGIAEMTDFLERLRYNAVQHRTPQNTIGTIDPSLFPTSYDRVHMSNVPDYVGGPLTSFLYGRPVLKHDKTSYLAANCFLNSSSWTSRQHHLAEYLLLSTDDQVEQMFAVALKPGCPGDLDDQTNPYLNGGLPPEILAMSHHMPMLGGPSMPLWVFVEYCHWTRRRSASPPLEQLKPREDLDRWLHTHLLKICVPVKRPQSGLPIIYAPLNLTAFLRLVARAAEAGYPAHWLSGTLTTIADNQLVTSAQMPQKTNMDVADLPGVLGTGRKARRVNVGPWIAEFTTLLALWIPLLPFQFVPTVLGLLPPLDDIAEYEIEMNEGNWGEGLHNGTPHNVLVLWDLSKHARPMNWSVSRDVFLQEKPSSNPPTVHMITTWKWVAAISTASFWIRQDVMDGLIAQGNGEAWSAFVLQADSWKLRPDRPTYLRKCRKLRSWA
ncbi:hypothetical protein ACHAQA_009670 [Verticillium albo-atrum]